MTLPVRFSTLKAMDKSPAHYQHALGRDWSTGYLRKGTAVHAHLLGGADVVVYEGGVRRGKEWADFVAAHPGATILIPSEARDVVGMRRSLERHETAMRLLEGARERTIRWQMNGRDCQGTPDVVRAESVVELKTAKTAHPEWFVRDASRLAYHASLAWYQDGLRAAGLEDVNAAFIVAVESAEPWPVTVFELTRDALEVGRAMYRMWWERLMVCEASDHWPAYSEAIVPFDCSTGGGALIIDGEETSLESIGF